MWSPPRRPGAKSHDWRAKVPFLSKAKGHHDAFMAMVRACMRDNSRFDLDETITYWHEAALGSTPEGMTLAHALVRTRCALFEIGVEQVGMPKPEGLEEIGKEVRLTAFEGYTAEELEELNSELNRMTNYRFTLSEED